jgi:hypothetical protein
MYSLQNTSTKFTNGATSAPRRHLRAKHLRVWLVSCIALKLKDWEEKTLELQGIPQSESDSEATKAMLATVQPAWTMKGFMDRLVKWIVVDDQVRTRSSLV